MIVVDATAIVLKAEILKLGKRQENLCKNEKMSRRPKPRMPAIGLRISALWT
jgi:hypothetical protein